VRAQDPGATGVFCSSVHRNAATLTWSFHIGVLHSNSAVSVKEGEGTYSRFGGDQQNLQVTRQYTWFGRP